MPICSFQSLVDVALSIIALLLAHFFVSSHICLLFINVASSLFCIIFSFEYLLAISEFTYTKV